MASSSGRRLRSARVRSRSRTLCAYLSALAVVATTFLAGTGAGAQDRPEAPGGDGGPASATKGPVGWQTYRQLGGLARLRGTEKSRQFSSFARDGSNDDGFEGTYSCLRETAQGECVIAERSGAGEITSVWFTRAPWGDVSATGDITVELDGRVVLDAPLSDVVSGKLGAPFVWPLVGNAKDSAGGAVIKVPMPYRESMRVTVDNNPYFHHVDYRTFADASGVRTFDPSDPARDVVEKLRHFGVADPKAPATGTEVTRERFSLAPGETVRLDRLRGPATINELRLRIPQVVASPRVVDDGRAFDTGGGSSFDVTVAPNNQGVRITRRFDRQIGNQVARLLVDGTRVGTWRSGAAAKGLWGVQSIEVPASVTAGKSSLRVANRFVSSDLDFNEFRYDVHSRVNGEWVRTDVLDLGPDHPGEEAAHDYRIDNAVFARHKLIARYPTPPERVKASDAVLTGARLRITFDGRTTVDAPVGEFFGSGLGEHDVRTLMSSIDAGAGGWYTAWWPMSFARGATVELVNTSPVPIERATLRVSSAPSRGAGAGTDVGYFHATHKRGHTQQGQDWNFLSAEGSGTFLGVTHTMRGLIPPGSSSTRSRGTHSLSGTYANQRNYLEGDERFYVDGASSPAWHGTGSEDFYESGWYFRAGTTFSMPLAGNPAYERNGDGCRYDCTGAYRLLVPDAVSFTRGLVAGIEHGPSNDEPGDYSSTAYWYGGLDARMHETDSVDLGDRGSRRSHRYTAEGERTETVTSTFEGTPRPGPTTRPTTAATGPVGFRVSVDPDNSGVRLRRLSDQSAAHQRVRVRVDGELAGTWYQPLGNTTHRWLHDGFDIPPAMTEGKSSIRVELLPVDGAPPWSASRYTAHSYE